MKRILLAVALLLLAVTAASAAPPARQSGQRHAQTVQRTPQSAPVKAPGQAPGTTTGQSARPGRLPSQAAAPLRLDATGGGTFNTGFGSTGGFSGQNGNGPIPGGVGAIANLPASSTTDNVPIAVIDAPGGGLIGVSGSPSSQNSNLFPFSQFSVVRPPAPNK
jgi:hypothetical protein